MVDRVTLYGAPTTEADAAVIADWLGERVDATVTARGRFLESHSTDDLPERFAASRVRSPSDRATGNAMLGAIRYEKRVLENPDRGGGVLYDGAAIQRALNAALSTDPGLEHLHVALLDRALGTWGDHDGRWHKRVIVLGQPAVISVPGLYEAPAKPDAYYEEKQRHALLSGGPPPREVLENQVEGEFLLEDDPRTTDALKGYALQAVHYLETGEAFCSREGCRLYNAHYHEALVESQLRPPALCDEHARLYAPEGDT